MALAPPTPGLSVCGVSLLERLLTKPILYKKGDPDTTTYKEEFTCQMCRGPFLCLPSLPIPNTVVTLLSRKLKRKKTSHSHRHGSALAPLSACPCHLASSHHAPLPLFLLTRQISTGQNLSHQHTAQRHWGLPLCGLCVLLAGPHHGTQGTCDPPSSHRPTRKCAQFRQS